MKGLLEYIFEQLILEYERNLYEDNDIIIKIGNHGDDRKNRGKDSNFKINLIRVSDKEIAKVIKKFKHKILNKISNNTLTVGNSAKDIILIDYEISVVLFCDSIENDKYTLVIKTIELTDDDYGNYNSKYNINKKNKDNRKIFADDL